jgi:hypothetical protein
VFLRGKMIKYSTVLSVKMEHPSKETTVVKLELLSNATTIDSALNYIRNKQRQQKKDLSLDSATCNDSNNHDQLTIGRQTVFKDLHKLVSQSQQQSARKELFERLQCFR